MAVDAVSLGEIERALRAGYVPGTAAHEIVFTADIIDEATLARVFELRIPVNCGSPDMVSRPIVVPRMPGIGANAPSEDGSLNGSSCPHSRRSEQAVESIR